MGSDGEVESDVPLRVRASAESERVARATAALLATLGPARPIGWKVGVNHPAVMRHLGIERSLVGALRAEAQLRPGASLPVPEGAEIAVEVEIALFLGRDVAAGASAAHARQALAGIGPALEVLDLSRSRYDLESVIAHNIFHHSSLFLDDRPSRSGSSLHGLPVRLLAPRAALELDPASALGDPGAIVALVADRLAAAGERLCAGDRILSGAMAPPVRIGPGEGLRADYGVLGVLELARDAAGRLAARIPGVTRPGPAE